MSEIENININDFAKVYLVVGEILFCEAVEGSPKLYKIDVDLGEHGKKQILSGVAKFFKPEDLIGKQGVCVVNLPPRKMLDLESQGMLLFSKDSQGKMALITTSEIVENGTRVT